MCVCLCFIGIKFTPRCKHSSDCVYVFIEGDNIIKCHKRGTKRKISINVWLGPTHTHSLPLSLYLRGIGFLCASKVSPLQNINLSIIYRLGCTRSIIKLFYVIISLNWKKKAFVCISFIKLRSMCTTSKHARTANPLASCQSKYIYILASNKENRLTNKRGRNTEDIARNKFESTATEPNCIDL